MLRILFHFMIIVVSLLTNSVTVGQDLGSECVVKRNHRIGVCSYINDCPHVKYEFSEGLSYTSCGSLNGQKVVCCLKPQTTKPFESNYSTTEKSATTTSTAPTPSRTHERMCLEYQSAIYQDSIVSGLIAQEEIKVEKCLHKVVPLIVGGENATLGEFPHMALLGYTVNGEVQWECGGSLISDKFVLTAGHCLEDFLYGNVSVVRLGELDYSTQKDRVLVEDIKVLRRFPGPNYVDDLRYNDIALIELERTVKFTPYIRPACLPSLDGDYDRFIASGWGVTSFSGNKSSILQKVVLDWFSFKDCTATYNTGTKELNRGVDVLSQFCAGSKEKKDACQGDSGGPMQIYHRQLHCMYTLVGITSFGQACATPGVPGMYTNIFYYLDWIERIVWKESRSTTGKQQENFDVRTLD